MSSSLKAFATHSSFITNTRLVEHPFGELSTDSRTYEKDLAVYSHNTDKAIELVLFNYKENNTRTDVTTEHLNLSLDVVKAVYDYLMQSAREIYQDELKNHLLNTFRDKTQKYQIGKIVTDSEYYCPSYVSWKDPQDNEFTVWFSDASFKTEYDEFEIDIIAPVENIDVFYSSRSEVEAELAKTPVDILTRKANTQKANSPVTVFRLDIFKWYNPVTHNPELDTNWYILIWGDAGDNIDAVRDKIQEEILKKSSHSRDEWKKIFPEIFRRNEFIIVPQWDVYSNENKVKQQASLYSPFVNYKDTIDKYALPHMSDLSRDHIAEHAQATSLYYRSIAAVTCGSSENNDNKYKLQDVFPDFIDVPSTSTDFNYQSAKTQKFSLKLQDMLTIAETLTPTSALPREKVTLPNGTIVEGDKIYSKVIRGKKLFLVMKYEGIHYLVASKLTINA